MYSDSGKVTISIEDPVSQSSEFDEIYKRLKEDDIIVANDLKMITDASYDWMIFRLPPLPPINGFNVFGQINNIKFSSAKGNIMIGYSTSDISAPSVLELRNIASLRTEEKVISIPIQIDSSKQSVNLRFQGTSEVYINGTLISMKMDKYRTLTNYLMLVFTLFSAIGGIISLKINKSDKGN